MLRRPAIIIGLVVSCLNAEAALKGTVQIYNSSDPFPFGPAIVEDHDGTGRVVATMGRGGSVGSASAEHVGASSNRIEVVQHTYVQSFGYGFPGPQTSYPVTEASAGSEIDCEMLLKPSITIPAGTQLRGRLAFYIEGEVWRRAQAGLSGEAWGSLAAEIPNRAKYEKKLAVDGDPDWVRISEPLVSGVILLTAGEPFRVTGKLRADTWISRTGATIGSNGSLVFRGLQEIEDETGAPVRVELGDLVVVHATRPGLLEINPGETYLKLPPVLTWKVEPNGVMFVSWPGRFIGYHLEVTEDFSSGWSRYRDSNKGIFWNDEMSMGVVRERPAKLFRLREDDQPPWEQ